MNIPDIGSYIYKAQNKLLTNWVVDPIKTVPNIINKVPERNNNKQKQRIHSFLSKSASVAMIALVIGGLIYKDKINASKVVPEIDKSKVNEFLISNRTNPPNIKKLAEYIEFKDAKTYQEAVDFGINNLGIKEYQGFGNGDLGVINWFNEGVVNVSNKLKGILCTPDIVKFENIEPDDKKLTLATASVTKNSITINKEYILTIRAGLLESISKIPKDDPLIYKKQGMMYHTLFSNNFKDCFEYIPCDSHSYILQDSPFSAIFHEMGHLQHGNNISELLYLNLGKNDELPENLQAESTDKLRKLFLSKLPIVEDVSDYATTSPAEFVAECFRKMCEDTYLPDEAIDLYKKFGGVMI